MLLKKLSVYVLTLVLTLNLLSLTSVKCDAAWEQVSNNTYYINDDGTYLTGIAQIGDAHYYFDSNGVLVKSKTLKIKGKTYRLTNTGKIKGIAVSKLDIDTLPDYTDSAYVVVNENKPNFNELDLLSNVYETYSSLDEYGRCGIAMACIGTELMPTEERGTIGNVKPAGWHTLKYDVVDGKYLYNRCHLIGFQLTAENANVQNLITGTRYLNVAGMLPFENDVAEYIKETGNHVLYRATPIYKDKELIARGVQIEAYSLEDAGKGICFNVFCYNVQPEIVIDYATGESRLQKETVVTSVDEAQQSTYIVNIKTKKYHKPTCSSCKQIKEINKKVYTGVASNLEENGFVACKKCKP